MQGIESTIDGVLFDDERPVVKVLPQFILGAAALALVGSVAAYVAHGRLAVTATTHINVPAQIAAPRPALTDEEAFNLFGGIVVEPGWGAKTASNDVAFPLPSLESASPAPGSEATGVSPPNPGAAPSESASAPVLAQPDNIPLPPVRDVARVDDSVPLPPVRPSDLALPGAPDRRVAEPGVSPAAPPAGPNLIQRLLGLGNQPSGPAVAYAPPARPVPKAETPSPAPVPPAVAVTSPQPQSGRGGGGFLGFFSARPDFDRLGYDRYTAVYDISARAVYLPDGTKLEAHSGL